MSIGWTGRVYTHVLGCAESLLIPVHLQLLRERGKEGRGRKTGGEKEIGGREMVKSVKEVAKRERGGGIGRESGRERGRERAERVGREGVERSMERG